jgi:hypothetical protein
MERSDALIKSWSNYLASDEEFDKSWNSDGHLPTWSPCQMYAEEQIYSLKKMFRDGFREF